MPRERLTLALDWASVRRFDADGRLHVATSHISKATVNPYRGSEIPDFQRLGLDPTRIYRLLRDPAELQRGAPTFCRLPLLSTHVPVTADEPRPDLVVGSVGSDVRFSDPYLDASLVVWDARAIALVESGHQRELSAAYRYDADMTPGRFRGQAYDGVMRNIRGNHVALVESGRAGPDVVVGDAALRSAWSGMASRFFPPAIPWADMVRRMGMDKGDNKMPEVMAELLAYLREKLGDQDYGQAEDLVTRCLGMGMASDEPPPFPGRPSNPARVAADAALRLRRRHLPAEVARLERRFPGCTRLRSA